MTIQDIVLQSFACRALTPDQELAINEILRRGSFSQDDMAALDRLMAALLHGDITPSNPSESIVAG